MPGTPLRGRDEPLAVIGDRLDRAVAGRGSVVLVEGRPGLGKTGLLAAAARTAAGRGFVVGTGTASPAEQAVPMAPVLAALTDGVPPVLDAGDRATLLRSSQQRYWLRQELEAVLERAALARPILLCLDDLQWADPATLSALRVLPARLAALPVVWLIAHRGGARPELRDCVDALTRDGATPLRLGPLTDDAVAAVVADLATAPPDAALRALAGRAHGSPFLLVELLRGLREEALVDVRDGRATLVGDALPARLGDGMRERLARQSDSARQVASSASVLGRRFSFEQLAAMLDLAPTALLAPVEELLAADLLDETGGLLGYRHDLIRDAVRDTLPASALRSLQRQAADALLRAGAPPVEVATQLAESAEPGDRAAVRTLREAGRSLAASDPGIAADLTRRALELTRADDPLRGPLIAETTVLLHASGRATEGKAFADRMLREALSADEEGEVRLSVSAMIGLSPDVRADASRRALAMAGLSPALRARHLANLVHNEVMAGGRDAARALAGRAAAAVADTGDEIAAFVLELAEGGIAYAYGDYAAALTRMRAAARAPMARAEPVRLILAGQWATEVLGALDRYDELFPLVSEGQDRAQRDHQQIGVRLWGMGQGRALQQTGRLADAAAALEGVVDAAEDGALVGVLDAAVLVALGRTALSTGNSRQLDRAVDRARALRATGTAAIGRYADWLLALAADGPQATADHLAALGGIAGLLDRPLFLADVTDEVVLVRMGLSTGDRAGAEAAAAVAADRSDRNPGVATLAGVAAHARGLLTGSTVDLTAAVRHLEAGPRPLALASALEDLARTAPDGAVTALDRALRLYADAGAARDAGRVRNRLRTLGVRRRLPQAGRPAHGWAGLTASEVEVVRLVASGLTNRDVAARLFLSPHTVSSHLRHAFTKLGVNSRMQLARAAAEHGAA